MTDLERVHGIDDGAVGIEARLIAAKALMKLEKPADAVALLEPATKLEGGAGRANLGLALAHFATGAEAHGARRRSTPRSTPTRTTARRCSAASAAASRTSRARSRARVEEALLYAQTYGDVWTDAAKKFLEKALADRPKATARPPPAPATPAPKPKKRTPASLQRAPPRGAGSQRPILLR